jgi:peroxiredoxin
MAEPAPDFALVSHLGESIRLSQYRGQRAIVLYFMRAFT